MMNANKPKIYEGPRNPVSIEAAHLFCKIREQEDQ
jgi:hypothetical protein